MGVINSPLVEGGVFSEEVNKKEVTVNGVSSNILNLDAGLKAGRIS